MVKLYPDAVYETPPTEFDDHIVELAGKVREAVKGWGTDENALLREMGDENAENRLALYHCYQQQYGDDLRAVMDSELGDGNLGLCMQVSIPLLKSSIVCVSCPVKGNDLSLSRNDLVFCLVGRELAFSDLYVGL